MIVVKYRHIGMNRVSVDSLHMTSASAEARVLELNCKPFTPYYAWIEKNEIKPAQNQYIGGPS